MSPLRGRVLIIAGSDSGGGAGIQADIKTFSSHMSYGMGVVTATTAAYESGTVFLGFEKGAVYAFRPETSEVVAVSSPPLRQR